MANGTGLAGDPAAVDADRGRSTRRLVAGREQWLAGDGAQVLAREVLVEGPAVDLEAALAGAQDHPAIELLRLPVAWILASAGSSTWGPLRATGSSGLGLGLGLEPARSSSSASSRARSSALSSRSGSIAIGSSSAPGGWSLAFGCSRAGDSAGLSGRLLGSGCSGSACSASACSGSDLLACSSSAAPASAARPRCRARALGLSAPAAASSVARPASSAARARLVGHRSISIGFGFWAACGWSGPA